jgi:hypothetical protein
VGYCKWKGSLWIHVRWDGSQVMIRLNFPGCRASNTVN